MCGQMRSRENVTGKNGPRGQMCPYCVWLLILHAPLNSSSGCENTQQFKRAGWVGLPNSGDSRFGPAAPQGALGRAGKGQERPESPGVFVCWGCRNQVPQAGTSLLWRLESKAEVPAGLALADGRCSPCPLGSSRSAAHVRTS